MRAWQLRGDALLGDVADIQSGTTAEGLRLGAMAGSVDVVLRVFAGIETRGDTPWLNSGLPKDLRRLNCTCTIAATQWHWTSGAAGSTS